MNEPPLSSAENHLDLVIAKYLEESESVTGPNELEALQRKYLTDHPDLAVQLKEFFADEATLDGEMTGVPTWLPPFENYARIQLIGCGGMGSVYQADEYEPERSVAIKMSLCVRTTDPGEARRFHSEADNLAKLDHPHILPVYRVGEHQGRVFFTMKLLEGGSLAQRVRESPFSPREAAELMVKVAGAVSHAHQRGILHRDLKPANILLGSGDRPKPYVCDFGLAKPVGTHDGQTERSGTVPSAHMTGNGKVVGTASYMSPEQACGQSATTLSDVYGLGAILYALLTGEPPFRGESLGATLDLVKDPAIRPMPPGKLNASVDADLEAICLKCLEDDPANRYQSVMELADELERWLQAEPVLARPIGPLGRLSRWSRRKPALAALAAITLSLLLVLATGITWGYIHERNLRQQIQELADHDREMREQIEQQLESRERLLSFMRNSDTVQRYWQGVEDTARDSRFVDTLASAINDADLQVLREQLSDPRMASQAGTAGWRERQQALARHPARAALQNWLAGLYDESDQTEVFAWFIQDPQGLQLARAPLAPDNLGVNFAWRSYFHGGEQDFKDLNGYLEKVPHRRRLEATHLSTDFFTLFTHEWVMAVSTPVMKDDKFLSVLGVFIYIKPPEPEG